MSSFVINPWTVLRFKICFSSYCFSEDPDTTSNPNTNARKNLHFHCMCCNVFSDNKLRSLRKHQRECCVYYGYPPHCAEIPKVLFLLEVNVALQQYYVVAAAQTRKRTINSLNTDPMSILASRKKIQKKASAVLAEIDDSLFPKCLDSTPICSVGERNRTLHYHCPICKVYTARRITRVKLHYNKCMQPKKRAKPRGQPLDLQCELIDKLNRIFLVRGSTQGPGLPCHVIYRAGPASNVMHCENGCRMEKKMGKIKCRHLVACEQLVRSSDEIAETGPDMPMLSEVNLFYNFDEGMKSAVCLLSQQCSELRVPVIRPYYPQIATQKPANTYYSVSSCTTPQYYSRCGRVLVNFNERTQTFKCKCGYASVCVHVLVSQLYHSHFVVTLCEEEGEKGDKREEPPSCSSEFYIQ